ncbi:MAG: hypothetical protein AAF228_06950 [Pseudomonadota bacterium]
MNKISFIGFFAVFLFAVFSFSLLPVQIQAAEKVKSSSKVSKKYKSKRYKKHRKKKKKFVSKSARKGLRRYIEFRARPNGAMDHSYIAYGYLTRRGKPYKTKYIGLHPKGGTVGMLVGVVAMEAQLDPMPEDKTSELTTSYRVPLKRKEYKQLLKAIADARKDQDSWGVWNPLLNNCNSFIGHIARKIGLKAPGSSVIGPTRYVDAIRDMNENEHIDQDML